MPPLPTPAQAGPRAPTFDIHTLRTHLPARERKSLLAQITPLAAEALPEPDDLGGFWLQAEEAVKSLDPSLGDLSKLTNEHMRQLAPVLLGAKGWQHY